MELNFWPFSNGKSKKVEREETSVSSFAPPEPENGNIVINASGAHRSLINLSIEAGVANEAQLIERYRALALYPECDLAIEEICNDAIVMDETAAPVSLDLSNLEASEALKNKMTEEFEHVLHLLNFKQDGYQIFRRWYVDSRIAYGKVVDPDNPKQGIISLRKLDPRRIRKVQEVNSTIDEETNVESFTNGDQYYVYNQRASVYSHLGSSLSGFGEMMLGGGIGLADAMGKTHASAIKIDVDAITYVPSGLFDESTGIVYGHLQKAIKAFNNIRLLEDALIIYRLARAPERRVIYIDTGNMNPTQSEQYVTNIQRQYRNKIVYDMNTGQIVDRNKTLSMQEDIWLPRTGGNRGTEISTLPGGQNLGEIEDVNYFKDKLYKALHVPASRASQDSALIQLGGSDTVSREELKFARFIVRLRNQFADLFRDLLKTQLVLKGIITIEEWEDELAEAIQFDFLKDSYYAEAREAEVIKQRAETAGALRDFIGVDISRDFVRRNIFKMTDEDIKNELELLKKELTEEPQLQQDDDGPGF